ncbi:sugar ABC transporter permease [Halostella sp. JP-L12]|uniref:carbohydrate ABC transporter permease n=1 Tax=Halostella TaxID=1843185 RepID=UPI000EF851D0|nr:MULTISPECIES: sugar ABC transporter permease [Halostella]NHN48129.1 sugar ABC transporter permease [Halostella sp. JP-L12]
MLDTAGTHFPFDSGDAWFLLVAPGLLLFSLFMVYPVAYLIYLSFTNARPRNMFSGDEQFVGGPEVLGVTLPLENYTQLFATGPVLRADVPLWQVWDVVRWSNFNAEFWNSFGITWLWVATSVTLKLLVGITIALVLTHELVRGKRGMRALAILPMGLPNIFTITVWRGIFSTANYGLANQFITYSAEKINAVIGAVNAVFGVVGVEVGKLAVQEVSWLTDRWMAFVAYNVTEAWLAYPFIVIITVSALQDVPKELHEAAKVDGAGFLTRFVHVTLPSIKRPVMFASILTAAASFQQFLIPFVFNEGGPGRKNELLIVYGYRQAFSKDFYGEGAAIMLTVILTIGVFMWINVKKGKLAEGVDSQ